VETLVAPNIDVVKKEVLIGYATKLGCGLGGVSVISNLNRSLTLPTITNGVVGIFQMVFTNSITTIHVNMIANQ
jgi:NH3-dependent NAD+ synthetase